MKILSIPLSTLVVLVAFAEKSSPTAEKLVAGYSSISPTEWTLVTAA